MLLCVAIVEVIMTSLFLKFLGGGENSVGKGIPVPRAPPPPPPPISSSVWNPEYHSKSPNHVNIDVSHNRDGALEHII